MSGLPERIATWSETAKPRSANPSNCGDVGDDVRRVPQLDATPLPPETIVGIFDGSGSNRRFLHHVARAARAWDGAQPVDRLPSKG